jgi:hypothetical protein
VCEEDATDVEAAPSSATRAPTSTASTADADEAPTGLQDDNSGDHTPDQKLTKATTVEMKLVHLRMSRQGGACREACFKENFNGSVLLLCILFCAEVWGW